MAAETDFKNWLSLFKLSDPKYYVVGMLYKAVEEKESDELWDVLEDGEKIFVKACDEKEYLLICNDKAKQTFLLMLEQSFCGDDDIDAWCGYMEAMEKND